MRRNNGQPQAIGRTRRGVNSPHHGNVIPCLDVGFVDGPVGARLKCPRTAMEVTYVGQGIPVPHIFLPLDQVSGAAVDSYADVTFAPSGAVTYNNPVPNYTGTWCGLAGGAQQGWHAAIETAWDPALPLFFTFDFRMTSTGGNRTIFTIAPTAIVQGTSTGVLQQVVTGATPVVGGIDHRHATNVHRVSMYWNPTGPAPVFIMATELENFTMPNLPFVGDGAKGIGSVNAGVSSITGQIRRLAVWEGAPAIEMGNRGGTNQGPARYNADRVIA